MNFRHELKHSLNYGDYVLLKSRLSAVMHHDRHVNGDGGYHIRSLYFDTPKDKALVEKISGVNYREKFRIRLYNMSPDFIRLEKKTKRNSLGQKFSAAMSMEEVNSLLEGNLGFMRTEERPLLFELYTKMRGELLQPKTIVDYYREPFICKAGNVRITFDHGIRSGVFSKELFNATLPTLSAGDEIVLLEVKYDQFIPQYILDILQLGNRRAAACSKYALARCYG